MIQDTTDAHQAASGSDEKLTEHVKARSNPLVKELLDEQEDKRPIWIRAPKTGYEHWTGLSRAKLYELKGQGKIETRSLRQPGQVKGIRLFRLKSVLEFIESCADDNASIVNGEVVSS